MIIEFTPPQELMTRSQKKRRPKIIIRWRKMWTTMASHSQGAALLCFHKLSPSPSPSPSSPSASAFRAHLQLPLTGGAGVPRLTLTKPQRLPSTISSALVCRSSRRKAPIVTVPEEDGLDDGRLRVVQALLWGAEAAYILWLFLLPYAPGDPVWAISSETVNSLLGLSLNFFFILPLMNSVGIRSIDAPVLHPMSEGLFNFVIGWTFMFAPLLFTDKRRDRYKGSLDVLWGFQMFLTNTFLIPYMAIRLNKNDDNNSTPSKPSQLSLVMTQGAPIVALTGGAVCLISTLWALFARADGDFGSITERFDYLVHYLGSERLAYAFIWDILLYMIFQPWLIGDNLQNVQRDKIGIVSFLRFVPVVGLTAYLLCLDLDEEL